MYTRILNINSINIDKRKNIFYGAAALIGLCVCMYVYFVTTTIRNIVAEKQLSGQISDVSQKLSTKEFSFIRLQNNVTLSYAQSLGFVDPKQKVFITPKSVSFVSANTSNGGTI